jgi:hypothetical protein
MPQEKRTYAIELALVNPRAKSIIEVEAHTPGLALKYAEQQNPGYAAATIDGQRVIGRCHKCEVFVIQGDRFERLTGTRLICDDCG